MRNSQTPIGHTPAKDWSPYFSLLDPSRGIAILAVLAFHGIHARPDLPLPPLLKRIYPIFIQGGYGVHLFFIISGYCMAAKFWTLHQKKEGVRAFLVSRFWRLMPVYWAAIAISLFLGILCLPWSHAPLLRPHGMLAWVANLFLLNRPLRIDLYMGVSWSLFPEWVFYLCLTLAFAVSRQWNRWILASALFGLMFWSCLFGTTVTDWEYSVQFGTGLLVFGVFWARAHDRRIERRLGIAALVILAAAAASSSAIPARWVDLSCVGFGLLLIALQPIEARLSRWVLIKGLSFMGTISYSLYLVHSQVQVRFINLSLKWIRSDSWLFCVVELGAVVVACLAGAAFYRWVERPLENLRKRQEKDLVIKIPAPFEPETGLSKRVAA
jgi:peptidoglycan/LPS O-acetylase OafA/YrhL